MLHQMLLKEDNSEIEMIEKELCSFYEYCKANGFTLQEMKEICKPLSSIVRKAYLIRLIKYLLGILIVILIGYFLCQTEFISWHLSAVGRIFMIKILPIWNWEKLANEKCLIPNFAGSNPPSFNFDCTLCEAIDSVPIESNINPYHLSEFYLDRNVPVIITDGLKNWPSFQNPAYNLTQAILSDKILSNSLPCDLSTNMFSSLSYLDNVINKSFQFSKWFFHFQNCDFDAVKQFRIISPRPYFLRPEISPVQFSWLLMSANYRAPRFKKLNLREKLTVFGQIEGSNFLKLTPRLNCFEECPILEVELLKGEAIVFTSLWDLEYEPNYASTNTAIILEAH